MSIDKLAFQKSRVAGNVIVSGTTTPNARVVVENQSIATFAPKGSVDAFVRGTADAEGRFALELPAAHEGDHLRVRSGRGVVGVRIKNVDAVDGRVPVVHQQGLRLRDAGDGTFTFSHAQKSDVVGEPAQIVRFTNRRTSDHVDVVLDARGRLPKDARLQGVPGDSFSIATTDGAHDTALASASLMLLTPCTGQKNPPPLAEHDGAKLQRLSGPLFARDPALGAVSQGEVGDCWIVSAVDALAHVAPQRLRELFTEHDDGTVTVSFHRFDHDTGRVCRDDVTVTSSVYVKDGAPLYGKSPDERWFPLLEKAWATWKGGYDGVVSGYPFEAFEALLGRPGKHFDLDVSSADAVWSALKKPGQAMTTWSRVDSKALRFSNTGLQADHAYAVVGVEERGGERLVTLRNPWGDNGWAARTSRIGLQAGSNGLLSMPLDVFMKYFVGLGTVDPR